MATGEKNSMRTSSGDYRWMRSPIRPEDRVLSAGGTAFLSRLPVTALPVRCAKQYPRLINRMSELNGKPGELLGLLVELCTGNQKGRQSFPDDIAAELAVLHRHFHELKVDRSVWQEHLAKLR
jgi:hypothetical protein